MAAAAPASLLLLGAGHAHLEVLRRLATRPVSGLAVTLVSAGDRHAYSGMVPGYLGGVYAEEEIGFHLPSLAARYGVPFVAGRVVAVDPAAQRVLLADGASLSYRFASFDLGSLTAGADTPGVAEHAALLKPFDRAPALRERLDALGRAGAAAGEAGVAVVGGGAAGVEVACAVAARLDRAGRPRRIALLEAGEAILPGYSRRFAARAARVLEGRRIEVVTGATVVAVEAAAVELADGSRRAADLTVWLAGPAPPPLFRRAGLPTDAAGYLLVDSGLRALGHPELFGAGDCVTLADHPATPKAGVYAVREAPVLHAGLVAAATGGRAPRYRPQASFLSLLNTADGRALVRYKGLVGHGRWAWRLKDRIDRRYMARYRAAR